MWERLRRARLDAGLSIDDLSARTKIRPSILESLEQGDLNHRLGDFYTRAALRAIARELKLDPDTIVREYLDEYEPEPEPPPDVRDDDLLVQPSPLVHPLVRLASVAMAAVVLVMFLTSRSAPTRASREAGAVGTGGVVPAPAAAPGPAAQPAKQELLSFELRTKGEVWVAATADGERVLYGLLQPSVRHVLEARQELTVVVGDAAAIDYWINGQPGRMLGRPAEVRKILVTPNNYAQFIRTQS